ncbi:hypothetical protein CJ199_14225, partial [Brevibacterium paucivorans]
MIAFGAAFVLPVLMVGLNMLDLLSARTIRRSWRWLVVLVFVFAAIATPTPDAVSMFYLVIPMLFNSVLVAAPTGAGKTVVAQFSIALAVARGVRVFYTAPIKALSNQKFNELVEAYGADRVGLLTGDTSINRDAQIVV